MTTSITPLPPAPEVTDPVNFETKAEVFVAALPGLVTEINLLAGELFTAASEADVDAAAALASKLEAAASATTAGSIAGAGKWLVGTTYAEGETCWSPISYLSFRRTITGAPAAGGTEPDTNPLWWVPLNPVLPHYMLQHAGVF